MRKKRAAKLAQERTITVAVVHPMSVTLTVRRGSPDGDWEVESIRNWNADVTPRSLTEHMRDDELAEMDRLADAAKDDE